MARRRKAKSSRTALRRTSRGKKNHRPYTTKGKHSKNRRTTKLPLWKRTNQQLTPKQQLIRQKSLETLSLVRREKLGLKESSRRVGLDPETVRLNTNAFRKVHHRWKVKKADHIPRTLVIYEKGRVIIVELADSRAASLIGEYHNRVKQFLETGKSSFLRKLPRKRFRDMDGKTHILETRPKTILNIKAREAKPEFFEIYRR